MEKESEKEKNAEISENSVEIINETKGEETKSDPKAIKKQQGIRLGVTLAASVITLLFFGLSFFYFTDTVAALIFAVLVGLVALAIVSIYKNWETAFKLSVTALYIAALFLIGFYAFSKSGLFKRIDSTSDLISYINNSGGIAEVVFILINFLQVTIVPIPSSITTTAGAILFNGIWKPLYLTVIGLVVGSMFAFFLGRVFGVRFANWLVGAKTIEKYKQMTKGKDKIVLFYMFLFPFFPDDFLCILAGMTSYTYLGFFLLQVFSRTIGTLTTILLTKGIVSIPLHGWWLLLWGLIIILVIVFLILTIKYSDKIEVFVMKLIDKLTFGRTSKRRAEQKAPVEGEENPSPETEPAPNSRAKTAFDSDSEGEKNDSV